MSILDSLYEIIYGTLLVIVTLKLITLFQKSINTIKGIRSNEKKIERLKNKNLNLDDINRLNNYEYILFCENYFKSLGYNDFTILNNKSMINDMVCVKDDNRILLRGVKTNIENKDILDFIGSMIENNIFEGIIIHSGIIKEDSLKILEKNKYNYSIKFINMEEIIKVEENRQYNIIESLT